MLQARDCAPLGWSMRLLLLVVPALLSGVAAASAQETGSITGVVADNTGAVLPGATVVVSGPALIEGSRTVFTDRVGQYRVIALRPGRYDVRVSLDGFSTVLGGHRAQRHVHRYSGCRAVRRGARRDGHRRRRVTDRGRPDGAAAGGHDPGGGRRSPDGQGRRRPRDPGAGRRPGWQCSPQRRRDEYGRGTTEAVGTRQRG